MLLRVLGCYGGSAPGMDPTCYLLDETVAVDAGALTSGLTLDEQARVDHVLCTHSHLDHLAQLPFLVDNVFATRDSPVTLHGSAHALDCVRDHLFNDVLWPDFSRLENGRTTLLAYETLEAGQTVRLCDLDITAVPMEHTVPCLGFLVQGPRSAVAICGDTVDVGAMVETLAGARGLAAIILEASFPREAAEVADASGHLTPDGFARELERLPADVPVYVTHMKPGSVDVLRAEIDALGCERVRYLEQGRVYEW